MKKIHILLLSIFILGFCFFSFPVFGQENGTIEFTVNVTESGNPDPTTITCGTLHTGNQGCLGTNTSTNPPSGGTFCTNGANPTSSPIYEQGSGNWRWDCDGTTNNPCWCKLMTTCQNDCQCPTNKRCNNGACVDLYREDPCNNCFRTVKQAVGNPAGPVICDPNSSKWKGAENYDCKSSTVDNSQNICATCRAYDSDCTRAGCHIPYSCNSSCPGSYTGSGGLVCPQGDCPNPDARWFCYQTGSTNTNSTPTPTHTTCQNQQCVTVQGAGTSICSSSNDCTPQLQNLYIVTNPFNDVMIGYEVEGDTLRLSVMPTTGTYTWFVRGTGGGILSTYSGTSVIYTPGTVTGEDVVSVSNGTNKAYINIKVKYAGNTPTFDIKTTNLVQSGSVLPLNLSVGADVGETIQFKAVAQYRTPENGQMTYRDMTAQVTWNSSYPDIGSIGDGGLMRAIKNGTTVITATLASQTEGGTDMSSNGITVHVNPTFPQVSPSGYTPHFNPNPVARGYSTRFWLYVESETEYDDIKIVSADLSLLKITPNCTGTGADMSCNSLWKLVPAEIEGKGRWYYMEFRVPFTVRDGVYNVRVQATSMEGKIDRHLTVPLRVVAEVMKGDVNGDGKLGLQDAILALQVATGRVLDGDRRVNIFADVNGNGTIGLPEAIYVLQQLTK